MSLVGSVVVLLLTWAHVYVLSLLLWCAQCVLVVSWSCLTGRLGSPAFLCRMTQYYIADYTFGTMYEWLILFASDDNYCMRPSNDVDRDSKVDLATLGVVTLDTMIVPDVFGLHAFDNREPVVRVLPGEFSNTVRVYVPDAAAAPVELHDVLVENLSNTPDYHVKLVRL